MAFDSSTRGKLQRLVTGCRKLLTEEFDDQLQRLYGIYADEGRVLDLDKLTNLDDDQRAVGALLRERIKHLESGLTSSKTPLRDSVQRLLREQAFTILNRFAALRMAEERELVLQCVGDGLNSKGFQVFENVASPDLGSQYERYRVFLDCLFDELSLDLGVLFDRFSPFGLLFPREPKLKDFLALLNNPELKSLWREDETIGWIYQYFNDEAERKKMREESSAPRNSRELAVRNQFFTPRYVVEFLTDNTLGRLWYEMMRGETVLRDCCRYLVRRPTEIFLQEGESAPESTTASGAEENPSQEDLLRAPVHIPHRPLKDPRTIRVLDPACGSMHFGLYAFDIFECIYDEAWEIAHGNDEALKSAPSFAPFVSYTAQFADKAAFLREVPRLIVEHNLHGIDIDPRAAQIAGLSLWLRAHRAWQRAGVKPADRPRITRSNLVCAEPMPGEKELLREFVEGAFPAGERPAFAFLLETIFDCMTLAGEAGSLLRIEEEIRTAIAEAKRLWKQGPKAEQALLFSEPRKKAGQGEMRLDLSGITDEQFFERAEQRIYDALEAYAGQAENGGGFQRRLFADDAAQGFAFIDLCRKRYDVVVMNPPYGEAARTVEEYLRKKYVNGANDIFLPFIERVSQLGAVGSIAGALTSRNFMFNQRMTDFRRDFLLADIGIELLADLGNNVLDAAVDVAAFTIRHSSVGSGNQRDIHCFNAVNAADRGERLLAEVSDVASATPNESTFVRPTSFFLGLPDYRISYSAPDSMVSLFVRLGKLGTAHGLVLKGLITGDDVRFVRAWSERPPTDSSGWQWFHKGGDYAPYHADIDLVVNWGRDGAELKADAARKYGSASRTIKNEDYFGRAGLGWGVNNSVGFAVKAIPRDCVFADIGPVFQPTTTKEILAWSGYLNSTPVKMILRLFQSGDRGRFMWIANIVEQLPTPTADAVHACSSPAAEITDLFQKWASFDETTPLFRSLHLGSSLDTNRLSFHDTEVRAALEKDGKTIAELGRGIDKIVESALSEDFQDAQSVRELITEDENPDVAFRNRFSPSIKELSERFVSYALGCVFGRWDIRYVTGERPAPELPDPFAPLPICPPGMLQGDDGLPLSLEGGCQLHAAGQYPLDVAWNGILVDDPEHPLDLERRVHAALQLLWSERIDDLEHEACALLGVPSLREWFRRPAGFFADHLRRYSKNRRQAPIYWPLSTASGGYTLWFYYPRLTDQTLYRAVTDFVKPKLEAVTADVTRLQAKAQTGTTRERAELEALSDFQTELQDLHDELLRVAQLPWKPNLNDGVLITASPLWKLFRLPKWQKDLKACWEDLAAGDYDWAHLAYSIWPDRVREKCKTDRSLAIAHSLEDICEVAAPKPKSARRAKPNAAAKEREEKRQVLVEELTVALSNILLGEVSPLDIANAETGDIVIPANKKITRTMLRKLAMAHDYIEIDPSPIRNKIHEIMAPFESRFDELELVEQTEMI